MQTLVTIAETRAQVRTWQAAGLRVAFVPTMGNLHDGHLALVHAARLRAERVVASVFVNPTQFGPTEDFARYPRTLEADRARLAEAGCDLLFAPTTEEMYPSGAPLTAIHVAGVSEPMCGRFRPGHFDGVATVVCKLFQIVPAEVAVFGEKDYQQLAVVRRLVADLDLPIEIVGVPTVRDASGLALSSRNGYLTAEERATAAAIYRSLVAAREALAAGATDVDAVALQARAAIEAAGLRVEYVEARDAHTLGVVAEATRRVVVAVAARCGATRLIDNVTCERPAAVAGESV